MAEGFWGGVGDIFGAGADVVDATGDAAKMLVQTLQQLLALVYKTGSWTARGVETLVAKAEMLTERIAEPSQPPPAPGVNKYVENDKTAMDWHYWRYNELYYLEELQKDGGPEKEFLKAQGVYEKLVAEESATYREIDQADIKIKELKGKLAGRIADRDLYTPEWDDAYHQIDGKPQVVDEVNDKGVIIKKGVPISKPYVGEDADKFETVENIKTQIEGQETKKRKAEEKLKNFPADKATKFGVLEYTDGVTFSLPNLVDLMEDTVKGLEDKYDKAKKNHESSKYYRELFTKRLKEDIDKREAMVNTYELKKADLDPEKPGDVKKGKSFQRVIDENNAKIREHKTTLSEIETFGDDSVKAALEEYRKSLILWWDRVRQLWGANR